ncbi:MAG: sterol desaturase family protein [bacterium]|nr:sterol desaturase family protein [bacterium]
MSFSELLQNAGLQFAVLFLVFLPLERLNPGHDQPVFRRGYFTDVLFFLGQYLLWTAPVLFALTWIYRNADELPLAGVRESVAAWPWWVQFLAVIFLSDLAIYWGHRLSHRYEFLWRFHRVHHTAERLDWLAAHREHPFDNLYTRTIENLPLILLGFPLHTIAGFAMARGLWAIYIHSNCSLTPGPLRYLIGAPRLHHWHHAIEARGQVNFANLSPLMDLMFGTYHDPGHMPARVGIGEPAPKGYVSQLVDPLLPGVLRKRLATPPESP